MIVIGGSLGGCAALVRLLAALPADFSRPILVALHRHKDSDDLLVPVIQQKSALPVVEAEDKMKLAGGRVYLAPADYHLLVDSDCVALSTDDLVNFARPSIDVLFESAAEWNGERLTGVVLSGSGSDGAQGARAILGRGGRVLIQDPRTAEGGWMPDAAIAATLGRGDAVEVLGLEQIAQRLWPGRTV